MKFAWACIVSNSLIVLCLRVPTSVQIAFDLFSMFMVVFNALNRPRGRNIVLLKYLNQDGIWFFFVSRESLCGLSYRLLKPAFILLRLSAVRLVSYSDFFCCSFHVQQQ